jgi:phage terminase Nu1 subunit (DNA packaging protein)
MLDLRASCLRLVGMNTDIPSADLQRLLGVARTALNDLAKRGIVVRGDKRGTYKLEASVAGYCQHLREAAAGRGSDAGADARARLGGAQASLAEARAAALKGEVAPIVEVEAKWTSACRSIRARVLAVADRLRDLPPRQHVKLAQELRAALSDLADG